MRRWVGRTKVVGIRVGRMRGIDIGKIMPLVKTAVACKKQEETEQTGDRTETHDGLC